jgi:Fe-S-cluster containining protein
LRCCQRCTSCCCTRTSPTSAHTHPRLAADQGAARGAGGEDVRGARQARRRDARRRRHVVDTRAGSVRSLTSMLTPFVTARSSVTFSARLDPLVP